MKQKPLQVRPIIKMKKSLRKVLVKIESIIEAAIIASAIGLSLFLVAYITFRSVAG